MRLLWTACLVSLFASLAQAQNIELASVDSSGQPRSNRSVALRALSADGRKAVFSSQDPYDDQDSNGYPDIYLRDLGGGTTTRVSTASDGGDANQSSSEAFISSTGRFVVFTSHASNIVGGDNNGEEDVFLWDSQGSREIVSIEPAGVSFTGVTAPAVSSDGRFVSFQGDDDVFLRDRLFDLTLLVSRNGSGLPANGQSYRPRITDDGRYVFYITRATDIVSNDPNGGAPSLIRYDTFLQQNDLVWSGEPATGINSLEIDADGSHLCFDVSDALVPEDTNTASNVYLLDVGAGSVRLVGGAAVGARGSGVGRLSGGGNRVSFYSTDVWHHSDNNVGQGDVYVWDAATHDIFLASSDVFGNAGNAASAGGLLSFDGRYAGIQSTATNFSALDTDSQHDVFVHDLTPRPWLVGAPSPGSTVDVWTQHLRGVDGASMQYLLSCSGTDGIPVPGGLVLPLTFDACTSLSLSLSPILRGPIINDRGALASPVTWPSVPAGQTLYVAGLVLSAQGFLGVTAPNSIVTE